MVGVSTLADIDVLGAEVDQSVDSRSLVLDRLADQIEVDRILRGLRFRDGDEDEGEASAISGQHADLVVRVVVDLANRGARPEPSKTNGSLASKQRLTSRVVISATCSFSHSGGYKNVSL